MRRSDVPSQVRIRTDPEEGLGHRYRSIEAAQEALGAGSRTEAVVHSCELVSRLTAVLPDVLEELPPEQAERVAEELSGRSLNVEYRPPEASVGQSD